MSIRQAWELDLWMSATAVRRAFIIAEKPTAARRIAEALDRRGSPKKVKGRAFEYYVSEGEGEEILVCPALGHLYTLVDLRGDKSLCPSFVTKWVSRDRAERGSQRIRAWIQEITQLSKRADQFINACDYDIEGSLIGSTILKYACSEKDKTAARMRFSTLTKADILLAYKNMASGTDDSLVEAGLARHEVDFLYGINLSRLLTTSQKRLSGRYSTISAGRVQSPTLGFVMQRDEEVNSFVPIPHFEIDAAFKVGEETVAASYQKQKIQKLSEANRIVSECENSRGIVKEIKEGTVTRSPPYPFDIGSLQRAAYTLFNVSPTRSMGILERLYLDALISYPRTGSQKLPSTIDVESKLKDLGFIPKYSELAKELVENRCFLPTQGVKEDPAHPAIYPTGVKPDGVLSKEEDRIYDLIVRRFFATLAPPARMKSVRVKIGVGLHFFTMSGLSAMEMGWIRFYRPYAQITERFLPGLKLGQEIGLVKVGVVTRYSSPAPAYSSAGLLGEMERKEIGTNATRTGIIETIGRRRYVKGDPMSATPLGWSVGTLLERHFPRIMSVEMTRDLEHQMNGIEGGKIWRVEVLINSTELLMSMLDEARQHEAAIGRELLETTRRTRLEEMALGKCPICKTGELTVLRSKKTKKRFVGCSNYWTGRCRASAPLPQRGKVAPVGVACGSCGWPRIKVLSKGRRPWMICVNPMCPLKKNSKIQGNGGVIDVGEMQDM